MWYLNASFDANHKVQDTLETRLEDLWTVAMSPLNLVKTFFGGASHPEAVEELEQLRHRVAELEAALNKRRK